MRRSEREIADLQQITEILNRCHVCRVAFAVDREPYIVPLSYGYDPSEQTLYFHTAASGKKIDCIAENPRVCFEVEGNVEVRPGRNSGCRWTLAYESVIGYGTISELHGRVNKENGLRILMNQHLEEEADWTFEEAMIGSVRVWRLEIDVNTVRGKRAPQGSCADRTE